MHLEQGSPASAASIDLGLEISLLKRRLATLEDEKATLERDNALLRRLWKQVTDEKAALLEENAQLTARLSLREDEVNRLARIASNAEQKS